MTPLQRGMDFFQGFMCSGAIEFMEKTNGNYYDMFTSVAGNNKAQPLGHVNSSMMGAFGA